MGGRGSLGKSDTAPRKSPKGQRWGGRGKEPQGRGFQVEKASRGLGWAPFCFFRARLPQSAVRQQGHQDLGVRVGRAALSSRVGACGRETAPLPG